MSGSAVSVLRCTACGRDHALAALWLGCPDCGGALRVEPPAGWFGAQVRAGATGAQALAMPEAAAQTAFDEGRTPLRPAEALAARAGFGAVWIKDETRNPTGTFKDRLNAVGSAMMRVLGVDRVVTSSTGNQAVSAAWFARRRGLDVRAYLPDDVPGTAADIVRLFGGDARVVPWAERAPRLRELVNDGWGYIGRNAPRPLANPYGIEGYKSIAVEIVNELGRVPDVVIMPTCGGDGFAGLARGFLALAEEGIAARVPRLVAVQPETSDSLVRAVEAGAERVDPIPLRWSIAHSLRDTQTGDHALAAVRAADGTAIRVAEDALRTALTDLGACGVFAEPAGAAGVAALPALARTIDESARAELEVVVVATGAGDRWPDSLGGTEQGGRRA